MASGDSMTPTVFAVNAVPSAQRSPSFSSGSWPSTHVAEPSGLTSSLTRMSAPPLLSVPAHSPRNGEAELKGEDGGPTLSSGWLQCGSIVAIIWSQTPNALSLPLERFVKARHAKFSDGTMYSMVATPGCPPLLNTTCVPVFVCPENHPNVVAVPEGPTNTGLWSSSIHRPSRNP